MPEYVPPEAFGERRRERLERQLSPDKVWVRADWVVHGTRGVYHWTRGCVVEAPTLVEVDRSWAEETEKLRPRKLCLSGRKGHPVGLPRGGVLVLSRYENRLFWRCG